jgi:hypothetical protein
VVINTLDIDDAQGAAATLMLPLAPVHHAGASGSVVFYSRTSGSFEPMADDVRWIFNLDGPAVLDAHLPSAAVDPALPVGVRGLTALCAVNQALGVPVVDGFTVPAARAELSPPRRPRRADPAHGRATCCEASNRRGTVPEPEPRPGRTTSLAEGVTAAATCPTALMNTSLRLPTAVRL